MKGLLGKLFSVKGLLLTAAAVTVATVAPLVTKPAKPTEPDIPIPRKVGDFTYHAEVTDITAINMQSSPRQGLRESSENGVTSVGNHSTPNPNEADHAIYIDFSIDNAPDAITIKYSHRPKSNLSPKEKVGEQLTADPNNNHVYFILPEEVGIGLFTQTIRRINIKNPEGFSVETVPTKDSKLNTAIRKYNRLFAAKPNQSDPEISELERAVKESASALGGIEGKIIEFGINGYKRVLEKNETSRRDFLKQKYGNGYRVIKAPLRVSNEKELGSNPIGRTTILEINPSELEESKEGYVEAQITFSRNDKRAGLKGLAYKFMIEKPKEAPIRKQLPPEQVLLGSWESLGNSYQKNKKTSFTIDGNSKIEMIDPTDLPILNASPSNIKDPNAHKYYQGRRTIAIETQDLIYTGGQRYNRRDVPIQSVSTSKRLCGNWEEDGEKRVTYEISNRHLKVFIKGKEFKSYEIKPPIKKIGETYVFPIRDKNGKKKFITAVQTGKNKMMFSTFYNQQLFTRKK